MSVIVRGIKKPNGCDNGQYRCPFLDNYDDCKLQDVDEFWDFEEMYKHCPLVEIPEGARLIDKRIVKRRMVPLDFSVQNWISEVDLDLLVPTVFDEDES